MPPRCLFAAIAPLVLLGACGETGRVAGDAGQRRVLPSPPRFSTPQLVAELSSSAIDEDPTFTGDLLEVCFMSNRAGTKDIWTSHRAAATDAWAPPVRVAELSSPSDDWGPALTPDGLAIWFATDRVGGRAQLWRASRADPLRSRGGRRSAVPELASSAVDLSPAVDAAELSSVLRLESSRRRRVRHLRLHASSVNAALGDADTGARRGQHGR